MLFNVGGVDLPRLAWPQAGNLVELPDAIYSLPYKAASLQSQVHRRLFLFQEPYHLGVYPILMWEASSPLGVMSGGHRFTPGQQQHPVSTRGVAFS